MSRRALRPVPRAGLGSPPSSWGRSSTSRAIVCHTKTSIRAASRSVAASSASSSSPASAARSIRRLWEQPPARRLILSTSSPFCVRVEASCFTATAGTDRVASGPTCSSCWLVRLLVLLSDHAANPATRAGRCNGLTNVRRHESPAIERARESHAIDEAEGHRTATPECSMPISNSTPPGTPRGE